MNNTMKKFQDAKLSKKAAKKITGGGPTVVECASQHPPNDCTCHIMPHGCCPNGVTMANGPDYAGCE